MQNIVEIVSHSSCQASYGLHFLRMQKMRLEVSLLGEVEKRNDGADYLGSVADWVRPVLDGKLAAILAIKYFIIDVNALAAFENLLDSALAHRMGCAVRTAMMMPFVGRLTHDITGALVAQQVCRGSAAECTHSVSVQSINALGG